MIKNSKFLSLDTTFVLFYLVYILLMIFGNTMFLITIAFIFCGTSYALESGSGEALVYDSLKMNGEEKKFLKINGIREIIFQLTGSIALLVGGYIALRSYNLSFWIVFIAFVATLIPILLMKETTLKKDKKHIKVSSLLYEHFINSTKVVSRDKNLLFLIIIGAFLASPVTTVFFYFQIHLTNNLNYSIFMIGVLLALHSLFAALGGYLAPKLESKYKEKLILYVVPSFLVLSFWLILIDTIVFVPFVLLGFIDSLFYVVLSDYINRIIPSEQRATVLSFNNLAFSLIMIVLFPVLGAIAQYYNFYIAFIVLAIFITISYISLLIYFVRTNVDITKKPL